MISASTRALWASVLAVSLSTLAACGGGGGDTYNAPAPPAASSSSASYWVRAFTYEPGTGNYVLRYYYSDNVADSQGRNTYYDVREARAGGAPAAVVYDTIQFVTTQGWQKPLDGATPNYSGPKTNNSYSYTYNYGYVGQTTSVDTDVTGQSIASIVAKTQDLTTNALSTIVGVNAVLQQGVMPAGAKIRTVTSNETSTPVGYRVSDGTVGLGVTTLAGMATSFPTPAAGVTITTNNTLSMGGIHGSAGCGASFCAQERMRGGFNTDGTVSLYLCDIDQGTNVQSNCNAIGTASYLVTTAVDGVTPIITFSGLPAAVAAQTFTRVFVQRNGHVYFGFQDKPDGVTTQTRLNKVAFEALAANLGITAPSIPDHPSAFAGTWSVAYAGGDTGSCAALSINAPGHVIGTCTSSGVGGSFIVSGTVGATGSLSVGSTSSDASFSGALGATTGSGTWSRPSVSATGTWGASKL